MAIIAIIAGFRGCGLCWIWSSLASRIELRQADRDKIMAMADAQHREAIARTSEERQQSMAEQTALLTRILEQNTQLTQTSKELTERIESLTVELHNHIVEQRHG